MSATGPRTFHEWLDQPAAHCPGLDVPMDADVGPHGLPLRVSHVPGAHPETDDPTMWEVAGPRRGCMVEVEQDGGIVTNRRAMEIDGADTARRYYWRRER